MRGVVNVGFFDRTWLIDHGFHRQSNWDAVGCTLVACYQFMEFRGFPVIFKNAAGGDDDDDDDDDDD